MAYPFNREANQVMNADIKAHVRRPRLWRALADLPVPALIVDGADDIRPSWPNQQIAHLLSNGTYVRIDGAGHCPWLTHADTLREHLTGFLHTLPPPGETRTRQE